MARWIPALLCIIIHFCILAHGVLIHFPNTDEMGHLPSGVFHWKYQRFDMYRVNPPLVRLVAGFPAWLNGVAYDWSGFSDDPGRRPEFTIGVARLDSAKLAVHKDFIVPRLFCLCFSLLGALILTLWVWQVYGALSANVACAFWCFSPDVLAHGQTIVPDVGAVAIGLVAGYLLWNYILVPSTYGALISGIGLGFALLTKLTWITGLVTLPLTTLICAWIGRRELPTRSAQKRASDCGLMVVTALMILNAGYLFEGSGTLLRDFRFCSVAFGGPGSNAISHGNRFENHWLGHLPIPFPKNYLSGIDYLKYEVEEKKWSFMLGEWRNGSWPHYYCVTTLIKTPEATLLAGFIGLIVVGYTIAKGQADIRSYTMILVLGIPAIFIFASVSLQGGFNHHHRYVMQIYPVMFVLAASLCRQGVKANWFCCAAILLTFSMITSSLRVSPHFLGYFNSASGGPTNGWRLLGFSNIDWGQDILLVDDWIREHPNCRPLAFELTMSHYSGNGELFDLPNKSPRSFRADATPNDVTDDCWYIVNVRSLFNFPNELGLQYLQQLEPVDRIGYSFHVYRVGRTGELE